MRLSFSQRQNVVAYLSELTDPDDFLACVEALMDAQGYRSLVRSAALGESEAEYLKRLRGASKGRGNTIPNCESVLCIFEDLVNEMEADLSA